jgi:hypothetical protein
MVSSGAVWRSLPAAEAFCSEVTPNYLVIVRSKAHAALRRHGDQTIVHRIRQLTFREARLSALQLTDGSRAYLQLRNLL